MQRKKMKQKKMQQKRCNPIFCKGKRCNRKRFNRKKMQQKRCNQKDAIVKGITDKDAMDKDAIKKDAKAKDATKKTQQQKMHPMRNKLLLHVIWTKIALHLIQNKTLWGTGLGYPIWKGKTYKLLKDSPVQLAMSWVSSGSPLLPWPLSQGNVDPCTSALRGGKAWCGLASLWTRPRDRASPRFLSPKQYPMGLMSYPRRLRRGPPWQQFREVFKNPSHRNFPWGGGGGTPLFR